MTTAVMLWALSVVRASISCPVSDSLVSWASAFVRTNISVSVSDSDSFILPFPLSPTTLVWLKWWNVGHAFLSQTANGKMTLEELGEAYE